MALSASGAEMVCGRNNGEVEVWNLRNGKELRKKRIAVNEKVAVAFYNHDQAVVAISQDGSIQSWIVRTGLLDKSIATEHHAEHNCHTIAPNCDVAASWASYIPSVAHSRIQSTTIHLWDLRTGK
ncbi:MAG: hypothetical protein K2V38_23750, partial [Gemmataceae bacterium]|nr:hypothetical protein [Gemmataceae bacterium]